MFCVGLFLASPALADTYNLDIARQDVSVTGNPVESITINGTLPGPTLRFKEGEDVTINVTNHMDEPTSIHWHGLILPGNMDGVPGLNGFPGIAPGETFTYHFPIKQSGTYWYHAHFGGQEQVGNFGSIVIAPKGNDPIKTDRDYVVVLSDFTEEKPNTILNHLKMDDEFYNYSRPTIGDFFSEAKEKGLSGAWQDNKMWWDMRMTSTDLSDVSGYTFLVNGKSPDQNWMGLFKPGERVRLRFINASAMTFFDLRIPGLKMSVVAADGQDVEPVLVDEFRFGSAETYDVIVEPKEDKAFTIVAEPIDRTGFALGTLATHEGMKGEIPEHRPRARLTMTDMENMPGMDMDMNKMMEDMPGMDMTSGWLKAGTPEGDKALSYADLRYLGTQKDTRKPDQEIEVRLGGNMQRYIWTLNGKKHDDAEPIKLKYGERVRLKFVNETMMAHPMHLHGMFVQLENGQSAGKMPNKHTVIVPPGDSYSVLLTADATGEWAFHCHLLYHMLSGMMTTIEVAKPGDNNVAPVSMPMDDMNGMAGMEGMHHHAH
jgi:FtsP/CotA-like multicopper oxidase with cupredoxin domain